ncbi:GH43 family beta-xylosidase [Anaerobacterium chartisolvens]|uniref:GH43 family beta-xylosidase n=1 Tax=Anaerobacterium chartisolvens TaxID=1297424 RepID=A0A369AWE9_9FIRM|nr:family 43 glycosylhydrolase [Anaerobacterium chartisolvens]RCX13491.1 GH43 family beta-xylosidase [Anaerobacterium chartisolvens]
MEDLNDYQSNQDYTYILCYTRTPLDNLIYSPKLAYSMHLAVSKDGKAYEGLNHNSGVLFAKATSNEDGTLNAKSLKNPYIFYMADGAFGVIAERTEFDGENDSQSKGCIILFTSSDLLSYEEIGLIDLKGNTFVSDAICEYNPDTKIYEITWCDASGNYFKNTMPDFSDLGSASQPKAASAFSIESAPTAIEGAVERNVIGISREIGNRVKTKLSVLKNTEIRVEETVNAASPIDVERVKATAVYNDGSKAVKKVVWDTTGIDWDVDGTYAITGIVHQDTYKFPIAVNRADPCIIKWKNKYYFIATNDDASIPQGIYLREAKTIPGLVNARESLILDDKAYSHINKFFWAPELHIVGDELYIFFAGSDGTLEDSGVFGNIHSHVMKLKAGGNPIYANDWEMPVRVQKKDGGYLFDSGITLDMTYFAADGRHYVMWAQRQFSPVDQGSWLYIANVDPKAPWRLINDPVLICKPEYGWENNNVIVDEGPFAIIANEYIFVTFSGALIDATYCVGMLTAERGADLLDVNSWTKGNYPYLTSRSVNGEYGPGHNSYVFDEDGNCYNAYHARYGIDGPRSSGIRRVQFDNEGYPVMDLTEELDLNKDLRLVKTKVIVKK